MALDNLCKCINDRGMTRLQRVFERYGYTVNGAAQKGIPYCSIWQQWIGRRTVGVKTALRYEKVLGIPRWELRPDLWEPPAGTATDGAETA